MLALLIGAGAAFAVTSITEDGMLQTGKSSAMSDAELLAEVAFAGATSGQHLSRDDLVAAEAQLAAARRTLEITRVLVWDSAGRLVFSDDAHLARSGLSSAPPSLARQALRTDRPQAVVIKRNGLLEVNTAVPFGTSGDRFVAQVRFPQPANESQLDAVRERLYLAVGIGSVLLYAALVPLMIWFTQRLPTREDRRRERALARLDLAMDREELQLFFQPKFSVRSRDPVGVEALVRWEHPERGLLGPGEFVPELESSRLLDRFTATVLNTATAACGQWQDNGLDLPVAVNISPQALMAGDHFVEQVSQALRSSGIAASMLTVEVTESALMSAGANATDTLAELRQLGVAISIDDFGTGYSSLGRLGVLPLDELKIDRSFVAAMGSDQRTMRVVRSIVDLGRQLGLRITAEGVETPEELEQLAAMGCDAVQGFLLARPMTEQQLQQWLAARADTIGTT
ncbi:MAG TPA: EAL domain-containing protein [Solirubrobacterales bacterium]|nr:EAL domain-containing protein [Solirubrobacterales bacterium]